MNASVKLHTAVAATAIVLFTAVSALAETFAPGVGEDGNITLPAEDYRKDWSYLGAFSVLGEEGAAELHIVYTQPRSEKRRVGKAGVSNLNIGWIAVH